MIVLLKMYAQAKVWVKFSTFFPIYFPWSGEGHGEHKGKEETQKEGICKILGTKGGKKDLPT